VLFSALSLFWAGFWPVSGCKSRRAGTSGGSAEAEAKPPAPIPKVDVHLHIDPATADLALAIPAENGIALGLNASGGEPGRGLETSHELAQRTQGRLLHYCNLRFSRVADDDWPDYVTRTLDGCVALGARGLKIFKSLGLGIVDASGALVPVDDPRLDIVFEGAGKRGLPVLIHSGDPKAFFEPNTPQNERHAELGVHPDWSFHGTAPNGQPWPSWSALLDQFEARVARHPHTQFLGAHFGNAAEDPDRVARLLARCPNYFIDTAARVPEFGRHPAAQMRAFFVRFQDRVLFGSDLGVGPGGLTLGSGGDRPGTRPEAKVFFDRHWAYFETNARRMPHPTPIQGQWTVDGIGLPRAVLEKLYFRNAVQLFHLELPRPAQH
jgi:predicted TIM-barrel fold metal-dependent hydrolase